MRPIDPVGLDHLGLVAPDDPKPASPREFDAPVRRLRRVRIEDEQSRKLEHARVRGGYAADVSPTTHDEATFKLINERKQLDQLEDADYIVPKLDDWKFWGRMNDWDSRNRLLEEHCAKIRRREATRGELGLMAVICRNTVDRVARTLRMIDGGDGDPNAQGAHRREEMRRIQQLDRGQVEHAVQYALLDTLATCPRPFPRRFFPWLLESLAHRALDSVRDELSGEHATLEHDGTIREVLDELLIQPAPVGSPQFREWLDTMGLPAIFDRAHEFAGYIRVQSACGRAVERLPQRQRKVIQQRYYDAMTQARIAEESGLAASTVRNTHAAALGNLRGDNELFEVLATVGKVRDRDRRLALRGAATAEAA